MPNIAVRLRRKTTSQLSTLILNIGDIFVDATKNTIVIGDGSTTGGVPLALENHTHSNATTSVPGFMSAADKTKLDGLTGTSLPPAASQNTPNTLVLRDGSGNFAAGQITATSFVGPLTGAATSI
jgi:hypothetical protein